LKVGLKRKDIIVVAGGGGGGVACIVYVFEEVALFEALFFD